MLFSSHVLSVFNEMNVEYDGLKNLMFDLAMGHEIYDEETGKVIPKREAESMLREVSRKIFGITEKSTRRERKRAYEDHGKEYFRVIEETVDSVISVGFKDSEWFNELVNYHNVALGDELQFWTEDDTILAVAKAGRTHHDHILQRLGEGEYSPIPMERYVVAVGGDIDRYLLGDLDWAKLVAAIGIAFTQQIQSMVYAEIGNAVTNLPASGPFSGTGSLGSATKVNFDTIIENVSIANGNSEVVIFGTRTALKNLNALADVNVHWIAPSQKEAVAHTGTMGDYEGTLFVEIPQKFKNNKDFSATNRVYNDKKLYIIPRGTDNKIVEFGDSGETIIEEITDRGEINGNIGDIMKYEVQRDLGCVTRVGRHFGVWTITP